MPPFPGHHQTLGRRIAALLRRRGGAADLAVIRPDDRPLRTGPGIGAVVAPVYDPAIARLLAGVRVPVLNTDGCLDPSPFPRIGVDQEEVAAVAYRHLAGAGCDRFAAVGIEGRASSERLLAAFARIAGSAGTVGRMPAEWRNPAFGLAASTAADARLAAFLARLGPGTGILAWGDQLAVLVQEALAERGPDAGVRLMASGDAEILDERAVGISAVVVDPGVLAAAAVDLLGRIIDDPAAAPRTVLLAPTGIAARASTGAPGGSLVARAMAILRADPAAADGMRQVAARLGVSTRSLERAFLRDLGRSPRAVRTELRIAHARALIEEGMAEPEVARRCGFARASGLRRLLDPSRR
jgi:AraC-like DNA-binding protein